MEIFDAVILGVVQGITEFVPISSSGHLIVARDVFDISTKGSLAFDAVLHLATAFAVLAYFWRDIAAIFSGERSHLIGALLLGTAPAVAIGLLFEGAIEETLRSTTVVAWALIAGSVLFVLAEWLGKRKEELTMGKGLIAGVFQAFALIPGVSRAGATISGGMLAGLNREAAVRFAFLLSFPILFGVGIKQLLTIISWEQTTAMTMPLTVGSVVAFLVGLGAIHAMVTFLKNHKLYIFAVYRVLLALAIFFLL